MLKLEGFYSEEVGLLPKAKAETDESITLEGTLQHLPIIKGWLTYMRQEAMLAGLALALLYFTVLR
jgi:hypothetical protein